MLVVDSINGKRVAIKRQAIIEIVEDKQYTVIKYQVMNDIQIVMTKSSFGKIIEEYYK